MMLFDRKKALNQIMGPPESHQGEELSEHEKHLHAIAKEAMDAVHAKDHVGYAKAQEAMHLHLMNMHDPDQDGDKHDPATGQEID